MTQALTLLATVLLCISLNCNPTSGLVEDNVMPNQTCYYCGFESPCPLNFAKDESSVRTIKCKKSCMKFDGWTTDQQKRVIVRDCGYYSTTECFNGKLDSRGTAEGSVCHCTTEKCNPGNRLKVEWLTTVLMPAIVLLSLLSAMLSFPIW